MLSPDSQQAELYKQQGNKAFKEGQYTKAIELYTKAITSNAMEPSFYANRAACYLALKKYQKCIQDSDATLDIDKKFVKAWKRKARAHLCMGHITEAKQAIEEAAKLEPTDSTTIKEKREIKEIAEMTENIRKANDEGRYDDASKEIERALNILPDLNFLKIQYIDSLSKLGKNEQAVKLCKEIAAENATNTDFLLVHANALNYGGHPEQAKKLLQENLRGDPDNTVLKLALRKINKQEDLKEKGNEAYKKGSSAEAIKIYTEAIELDAHNKILLSTLYANRGLAYLKQKKYTEALDDCNKAIEYNEKYVKAFLRRGDIRIQMGDFEEAVRDYQQARQLDPHNQGLNQKIYDAQAKAKKASKKDFYKILGVEKTAKEDEIKKAYRKLALKWHPDKHTSGTEEQKKQADKMFKDISEAYSVISDPKKRQQYDVGGFDMDGGDGSSGGGFQGFAGGPGFDPNVIFRTFFGGGGGGGDDMGGFGGGMGGFPTSFFTNSSGGGDDFGGFGGSSGGFPGGMKFTFASNKNKQQR
jgi:DnaJ family protein C protein 7